MSVKEALALFAMFLAVYCVVPYIKGILAGTNKPHLFTWIIFTLITGIVAAVQFAESAGPGKWVLIVNALGCVVIVALSFKLGNKDIKRSDWVALAGAFLAIPVWLTTDNPLGAILIAITIELFAFYPTLRKSWAKPHEEVAQTWLLGGGMFIISVAALEQASFTTAAYPLFAAFLNLLLVAVLLYRRRVMELPPAING